MIVTDFFQALQAGKELANAETWKDAQQLANSLTALGVAAVGIATVAGVQIPLTPEQVTALVNGFLVVLGLFNWAATAVSSKRVGLVPARRDAVPGGTADGSGDGSTGGIQPIARPDPGADDHLPVLTEMDNRG